MKAILLLLIALAIPAAVSAQDDRLRVSDDRLRIYGVAVELYRHGQVDDALRIAGSWKSTVVKSDGGRIIAARDHRLASGVALLMTELARRDSSAGATERLALAEAIVTSLSRGLPETKAFQEHWYAFVASLLIAELDPSSARIMIDRGMRLVGKTSRLLLLSGMALEVSTYPHATCPTPDCQLSGDRRARALTLAADAYREASALDPHLADAHLRLARALHLLGDAAGARQELAEAERISNRAELLYLVALFRADLKQADGDLKGAAADAEHAVALGPEFQSARIALAHLNDRLGQADRSRQIVDRLLKLPPVGDPWWDFKQPTEDADSLEAMRASLRE